MPDVALAFKTWILQRAIEGVHVAKSDDNHILLTTKNASAHVNFFEIAKDKPRVVEFLIERQGSTEQPLFHLHFELTDLSRAKELFEEMLEVLMGVGTHYARQVLLCCTTGLTTTMFAQKLNETAKTLSLDYEFFAKPLDEALKSKESYIAVMLAPQVGFERETVVEAYPDAAVFEIPAKIYGTYDAGACIRLLLDVLDATTPDAGDLRMVRDVTNEKRILVIYVNLHRNRTTIRYRLYEKGKVTLGGRVAKLYVDFRDVEELFKTLSLRGLNFKTVDAVGVVVPGIVDGDLATFPPDSGKTYDFGKTLQSTYGTRVFVENDANAAAVGCYVTQSSYDNVSILIQQAGHIAGAAGSVEDGRLIKGRRGFAGEIGAIQKLYLPYAQDDLWDLDVMLHIACAHVVAASCLLAPDAFFMAVDMVSDMEALKTEVEKYLPASYVPDFVPVFDVRELIFVGMLALTLRRLEAIEQAPRIARAEE